MSSSLDNSYNSDNTCVVCFKNVDIYSIGVCDHPVCYECSTRMRVLCLQNECPICRQDLPKVIFTKKIRPYKEVAGRSYPNDKQFKILFDGGPTQNAFLKLLKHSCQICGENKVFETFHSLSTHMRREHELFFCDLCVDNLKIFTHERRVYNRQQLAHHKRKGDPDDKSHKGHPLCEFCDQRYMDNDELFRHLRKDHLFCHFCDADGFHQYYSSYDYLRDHFKKEHFLCEEGACYEEKFTSAFRSEIDLKAHKASIHSKMMGKQATKQARTLELEFTLAPRPRERPDRNHRGADRIMRSAVPPLPVRCNHAGACNCGREDLAPSADVPVVIHQEARPSTEPCLSLSDFPSLGSSSAPATTIQHGGSRGRSTGTGVTIRASAVGRPRLTMTDENFPALSEPTPSQSHKVWLSVNSRQDRPTSAPTNFSIHLNSRQRSSNTTGQGSLSQNLRSRAPGSRTIEREETDFPALKPLDTYKGTSADQWASTSSSNQAHSKVNVLSASEAAQLLNAKPSTRHQSAYKPQILIEKDFPSLGPVHSTSHSVTKNLPPASVKASMSMPVSNSSSQSLRDDSPALSSDSEVQSNVSTNAKSKKKKKKSKTNNNIEEGKVQVENKKVLPEQSIPNSQAESNKKKKKQKQQLQLQQESETQKEKLKSQANKKELSELIRPDLANQENTAPCQETSQNGVGRKRSELQIESLHINDEQYASEDPTNKLLCILRGDNYVPKAAIQKVNPPPGFEKTDSVSRSTGPPPGFSVEMNSVARPPSNQLTFTSSSGESYPILPSNSFNNFVQPPDFQRRNTALMARVVETLQDPNLFEKFRQMSIQFRQGQLSSASYYKLCLDLMGEKAFNEFFPEMLVLLPEIDRQQDLFSVFKKFNSGKNTPFEVCATCQQVLSPSDLRVHVSTHTLQNHFPALSSSDTQLSTAWGRK